MVIKEIEKEKRIENRFKRVNCKLSSLIKVDSPKKLTAAKVGIESKKEILAESTLLKFKNLAAVIDMPDLLTPGINAKI